VFWVFQKQFVIRKLVHKHFCIFLKKTKKNMRVWCLLALKNALLPCCWKHFHLLFFCTACISSGSPVCHEWTFLLVFPSFLSLSSQKNYSLILLVISISSLILILLIFLLLSWLFCRILLFFNFIIESQFINYYILQFDPYFLNL
jgi:hypothetical protein